MDFEILDQVPAEVQQYGPWAFCLVLLLWRLVAVVFHKQPPSEEAKVILDLLDKPGWQRRCVPTIGREKVEIDVHDWPWGLNWIKVNGEHVGHYFSRRERWLVASKVRRVERELRGLGAMKNLAKAKDLIHGLKKPSPTGTEE